MVERVIEEKSTEPVVIREENHDHVRDTSGSNVGVIIAVVVIVLLLLLLFGRGLFNGSGGSSTPDVNVTPSSSSGSQ